MTVGQSAGVWTAVVAAEDVPDRVTVRVDPETMDRARTLVDHGVYQTTSAVVRAGVRRVLTDPSNHEPVGTGPGESERVSLRLTPAMVAGLQRLVEADRVPTRSDAVRDGVHRVCSDYQALLAESQPQPSHP